MELLLWARLQRGILLGGYRFDNYKKRSPTKPNRFLIVTARRGSDRVPRAAHALRIVSEEVNRARDLVNEPGDGVYPETLGRLATEGRLARQARLAPS